MRIRPRSLNAQINNTRAKRRAGIFALAVLIACRAPLHAESEADKLIELMGLRAGMAVADIGAGEGQLSIELARRLGSQSIVYSTELEKELSSLQRAVRRAGAKNIRVVEAGVDRTNLPPECCHAIVLRQVYHHFQRPTLNNRSAFENLRPGGLLAIIDFEPKKNWNPPQGVHHRGGHGVSRDAVIRELTAAGFDLVRVVEDWPEDMYAVLVRKPKGSGL